MALAAAAMGRPTEVLLWPRNSLVARLMDAPNIFEGVVEEQSYEAGVTLLRWKTHRIQTSPAPQFAVGTKVGWLVPTAAVVLNLGEQSRRAEGVNLLVGSIRECISLGRSTTVSLAIEGAAERP
jgi:ABC-type Fe3+/spermidine/putrescine transport system ATPase subunit